MAVNPTGPIDTYDMHIIHAALRTGLGRLPGLIRKNSGNPARSPMIAAHIAEQIEILHSHHHGEDELLYPLLEQRDAYDEELFERMEAQHSAIGAAVDAVNADLDEWGKSADPVIGERLAATIEGALPGLEEHLKHEEDEVLPIVAENVTQAEWDKLGEHGMASIPGNRKLVVLGYLIEASDPAEAKRFLKSLPFPVRVLYPLVGRPKYKKEIATLTA